MDRDFETAADKELLLIYYASVGIQHAPVVSLFDRDSIKI
jgi:hypothetical protein